MREIRFRAWHLKDKFMTRLDFPMDLIGDDGGEVYNAVADRVDDESLIWMQFTGLKDKAGVEIYEGDIVKSDGQVSLIGFGKCWINGFEYSGYGFYYQDIRNEKDKELLSHDNEYDATQPEVSGEVIGNIHENPELIKEEVAHAQS